MDFKNNYYLAGFADGEGCFMITEHPARTTFVMSFHISQRADSISILENLQQEFGGGIYPVKSQDGKRPPGVHWKIGRRKEILGLIEYFDQYHPIVKGVEYDVWREAALLYYHNSVRHRYGQGSANPTWLVDAMRKYSHELKRLKKYNSELANLIIEVNDEQMELFETEGILQEGIESDRQGT